MVLDNKVLWNNEMTLVICLKTELDKDEFQEVAIQSHVDLTGDVLEKGEYIVGSDSTIRRLEVI